MNYRKSFNQDVPTLRYNLEPDHERILKLRHELQTPFNYRQMRTLEQFIQTHLPQPGFRLEPVRINVRERAKRGRVLMDVRVRRAGDFAREVQSSSEPFGERRFSRTHHPVQDQDPSGLEISRQVFGEDLKRFGRGDSDCRHVSSVLFVEVQSMHCASEILASCQH
jgi:hypothetical protein